MKSTHNNATVENKVQVSRFYMGVKAVLDFVFALSALLILLPFLFIFAALIYLADFHSPFYFQERIGKDGKPFRIIKFRSMRYDAHELEKYFSPEQLEKFNSEFKVENDPRITRIGRFIRKFSIDEFPQLLNVLAGQMSLVGPRPLTLNETYFFGDDRDTLLSVRPGITGLWQVSGRNALTYESGKRQECEIRYVKNFGILMDIKVIFKTFGAVIKGSGI